MRRRISVEKGAAKLRELWGRDPHMKRLDNASMDQLMHFFEFATVPANREIIQQDEYGNLHDRAAVRQHRR